MAPEFDSVHEIQCSPNILFRPWTCKITYEEDDSPPRDIRHVRVDGVEAHAEERVKTTDKGEFSLDYGDNGKCAIESSRGERKLFCAGSAQAFSARF